MKTARLILFSLLVLGNCIRFKYDNLSPGLITKIRLGDTQDAIEAITTNNVVTNVPLEIPVSSDYLFVADYLRSNVKLFDYSGNLEMVLGPGASTKKDSNIKTIKVKLVSIGIVLPGNDDDVYIENKTIGAGEEKETTPGDPFESLSGNFNPVILNKTNSFIIHISLEGDVINIIGTKGPGTESFEFIEKIHLLKDNQIAVFHVKDGKQMLTVFKNDQPLYTFDETTIQPLQHGEEGLNAYLDTIIPHISGEYSLFSYKYFDKKNSRFKFRRIFRYDYEKANVSILKEIQDPAEILFAVKDDNDFYIWETETSSGSIRLQLHDKSGYHYNNKRIVFPAPRAQWRETYTDAENNLYSIRIRSGNLEVYKWN